MTNIQININRTLLRLTFIQSDSESSAENPENPLCTDLAIEAKLVLGFETDAVNDLVPDFIEPVKNT